MNRVLGTFWISILILSATGTGQAQGISSILERLETLEQRVDQVGSSGKLPNMSGYDEILSNVEIQLAGCAAPCPPASNAPRKTEAGCLSTCAPSPELEISGFADQSIFFDSSSNKATFGFDQVEVDIIKNLGATGSLRVDLEWASDGEGGFTPDVEQGFVTFRPEFAGKGAFTFGKFNAPIGFELLDAPDMFQYSHALVFNHGLPTNLSGLMYNAPIGAWDLAAYVCNGWDVNVDPDNDKTVGCRLGYSGCDRGGLGFSIIHGNETFVSEESYQGKLTVFDIDAFFDPAANWTTGAEFNLGNNDLGNSIENWWGFLVMSHWDFTEAVGATIRYDYFDDTDNSRLESGAASPEVRQAIAVAPTFVLGDGMGALIEARVDFSDQEVFDDNSSKSEFTLAFEMTYTF
ncbi:MAG: porin [Gemmatimonadales bacterium]|nr:porin [Gemmatimonadales bacterium]